jgi:hypothetical protein
MTQVQRMSHANKGQKYETALSDKGWQAEQLTHNLPFPLQQSTLSRLREKN